MKTRKGTRAKWVDMINNGLDARALTAGIANRLANYADEIGDQGLRDFLEAYWGV